MRSAALPVIAALTFAFVPAGVAWADGDTDLEKIRRCEDLREAGVSLPVDRDSKYYRSFLDRDKDGLACEDNERKKKDDSDKKSKDEDDSKGAEKKDDSDDAGETEDDDPSGGDQTSVYPKGAPETGGGPVEL
jgi:hypothetical protein